jgi:predicted aspartyl protease
MLLFVVRSTKPAMNRWGHYFMRFVPYGVVVPLLLSIVAAQASVTMRWDSTGHLLVPVFVNGAGPYPFILDDGADESAVYHWFAVAGGLPKGRRGELNGAVGNEPEVTTQIESLSLDGHAITHVNADTIPDRPDGAKIAGVAGVDLMIGRIVVMDTGCGTAAVLPGETNPDTVAGARATLINAGAIRGGKQLTLPVSIDAAKGVAILDTGAKSTMINRKFAQAGGLRPDSSSFKDGPSVHGATAQIVRSRIGPVGIVRFAGMTRDEAVARVVDLHVFEDAGLAAAPAMILGLDMLRDTRLTIDYAHRRFWMAMSACQK